MKLAGELFGERDGEIIPFSESSLPYNPLHITVYIYVAMKLRQGLYRKILQIRW